MGISRDDLQFPATISDGRLHRLRSVVLHFGHGLGQNVSRRRAALAWPRPRRPAAMREQARIMPTPPASTTVILDRERTLRFDYDAIDWISSLPQIRRGNRT